MLGGLAPGNTVFRRTMNATDPDLLFESIPERPEALSALVRELHEADPATLRHGMAFTGRPETRVRYNERYVLKFPSGDLFHKDIAQRRIRHFAERDRKFGIAHPDKTWIGVRDVEKYFIANLAPRLNPLHTLLPDTEHDEQRILALETVVDLSLKLTARFGYGLDPGLSNFGMDEKGHIFYLDDEYYKGNDLAFLVQTIQLWFRSYEWLSGGLAERLGDTLSRLMLAYFHDKHLLRALYEELRSASFQNAATRSSYDGFLKGLTKDLSPTGAFFRNRDKDPRIAVLADVHANLPALEAVLEDVGKQNIGHVLVLGDIVGYGPFPAACVSLIRSRNFKVVKGNHDHGIANGTFEKGFSRYAAWVAGWSYCQMDSEALRWLDELPLYIDGPRWLALHGAPCDRHFFYGYVYQMTYEKNLDVLKNRNIPICFHGHTHLPGVYYENGEDRGLVQPDSEVSLRDYRASLVCPGSVGQPRNGCTDAQYMIFDSRNCSVLPRKVPYDIERTLEAMRREGFPETLMQRLEQGC